MPGDCCSATPRDSGWPVCALPAGHPGQHESADFTWNDGEPARLRDA